MKRLTRILLILVVVGMSMTAASCPIPLLFGTWFYTDGFTDETITISATLLTILATGSGAGSVDSTVDSFNETTGQLEATVTGTPTGTFSSLSAGSKMYWLLALNAAGQLFQMWDAAMFPTGDPVADGWGPYDKQ